MIRRGVFPLLLTLLALVACNGGGEEAQLTPTPSPAIAQPSPTPEPTPEPTPTPEPAVQRIAYIGTDLDVWIINADGSGQTRLTDIPALALDWSPDGSRIAFATCEPVIPPDFGPCNDRIYVINVDGSNLTLLAEDIPASDLDWSPDGARIAFPSRFLIPSGGIYVINADGSGLTRLINIPGFHFASAWSPDGKRIAFISDQLVTGMLRQEGEIEGTGKESFYDIYAINTDGSGLTPLTNQLAHTEREGLSFAWSPDGSRIAAQGVRGFNADIYVMNADGSESINLTNNPASDTKPVWSPDGSRIAFLSTRDGNWEIHVMNADGSGLTNLTKNAAFDANPVWSPDGSRIVFVSDRDGSDAIYLMNVDGSNVIRLIEGREPAWQPQP